MRADHLLTLAAHLETKVPKSAFNLSVWKHRNKRSFNGQQHPCGFAACAIGWAVEDKIIPGLGWSKLGWSPALASNDEVIGFDAVAKSLEISNPEALYLFSEQYYDHTPSTCEVAARIRQFIADGKSGPQLRETSAIANEQAKLETMAGPSLP